MDLLAKLKALYKECFSDSDECAEYLFQTRLGIHNALFSQSNGVITSSLYLVDKKLDYCGKTVGLPFVVGLCTKRVSQQRACQAAQKSGKMPSSFYYALSSNFRLL